MIGRFNRRSLLSLVAAVLWLTSSACGSDGDAGDADSTPDNGGAGSDAAVTVAVKDDFFDPEEVEVAAGGKVTWTWEGSNPHNVQSDDFKSEIQTDGTFDHTFEQAGTFNYICTVHPSMTAKVVVTNS